MKKRTLDEFIEFYSRLGRGNEHLDEPNFEHLYVRYNERYIYNQLDRPPTLYKNVLDIANISVYEHKRGQGVFTIRLAKLRADHPGLHIYVENANENFQRLLLRLDFKPQPYDSFFLESQTTKSITAVELAHSLR